MFWKSDYIVEASDMGCCSCFGFTSKPKRSLRPPAGSGISQEFLLGYVDGNGSMYNVESTGLSNGGDDEFLIRSKRPEEILSLRLQSGRICREFPVKETHHLVRTEDENGNKMINEYVHVCKIGSGSYGKVVLYQSSVDGRNYAIKAFHKSHLLKLRVAPSETAMTDVFREVSIMKMLDHPNIVNLIEVIDDPNTDHFYMVLEYVEGKWVWESSGPLGTLGESTARKYLRDVVAGLMYLHDHNIVHGDIKPDNLLVTSAGTVKIGDFGVSQVFEDDNDELRRSPGTPVFTAPECCLGLTYHHGKAADTWAVGVTLYCMVMGQYPFLGETLQDTYDKIVNNPLLITEGINPRLQNLLEGLLCKDPKQRLTLDAVARHPWVVGDEGPIPQYLCWCRRESSQQEESGWGSKQ
ncbi:serine/threonine-protein kinase GRIK1-like isoform X2 [Macadamia integrifolia]|nr:serine/threonine-protein kinase GRIK1-like isoform X2 [Macadamia integrifolia]XP_042512029.1 serine/threonine-protein kinase GRIK1-like isoform X2 [Macadamia integrifolia]XP_042512030.1 serine/threonine-protein kinase GRIK1-like isoform X2 [Macadamia integrifolia]XP_042512031.1 serine/threonine-protein kinase GRIK1-like isoform X2 [Macadamia integrifolia]